MKKGQIGLFIVIGVIIITLFIVMINVNNDSKLVDINQEKNLNLEESENQKIVRNYIESCLKQQSEFAIDISLFNNVNYQRGNFNKVPQFPTLVTYDLWMHNFDIKEFSLDNLEQSLENYLQDTLGYCLKNFEPIDGITIQKETNNFDFDIKIQKKDIIFNLYFPLTINELDQTTSRLETYQYKSENVPLKELKEDVNNIVNMYSGILQNVDGKTNGSSRVQWGNTSTVIDNLNNPNPTSPREDLLLLVNQNLNQIEFILKYNKPHRETYYTFSIISTTGTSMTNCPYCNNVENIGKGSIETLNPTVNITVSTDFFENNIVYENIELEEDNK